MIVLAGIHKQANCLHVVVGEETEAWLALHGNTTIDITDAVNQLEDSKPVFLKFNRCDNEQDAAMRISDSIALNNQYPFMPPSVIFSPRGAGQKDPPAPGSARPKVDTVRVVKGTCDKCGNSNGTLVPGLEHNLCYACVNLDIMLAGERRDNQRGDNV